METSSSKQLDLNWKILPLKTKKALVYFEDAESDPDPEINLDVDWGKVKSFFGKEIPLIMDKLI